MIAKKMIRHLVKLSVLMFVSFLAFAPRVVYAYLDPGTGSMIIQIFVGFLAGFALIFKRFWSRLFSNLFRRKPVSHDEIKKD